MKVAVTVSVQEFVMGIKEMPRLARFIPKIMLAITVTACDEVYRKIACWLNDMGETLSFQTDPHILELISCLCFRIIIIIIFHETALKLFLLHPTENYRLQSAYEKNLIIKMVLVSDFI